MSKSVDQMFSVAEHLFELSQNDLTQLRPKDTKTTTDNCKSLDDRLLDLLFEEKSKPNKIKSLSSGSFILKKLVAKEKLNHLVVSLFAGNEGYSIGLKLNESETLVQTMRLPYEENQLLDYIDNEELPPFLVDFIDNSALSNCGLFQSGCLIVEVRDYRRSANTHSNHYSSNWVLLKPTSQSLYSDVMNVINTTSDEYMWTNEDRAELESRLMLAMYPNICLDPNPAVAILSNKLCRKKRMFKDSPFVKLSRRCSQLSINRIKRFESLAAPKPFRLHDFLKKKPSKNTSQTKQNKTNQMNPNEPQNLLIAFNAIDVQKIAKELPKIPISPDTSLVRVEEYTMDFMDDNKRSLTNVKILHRPIDDTYFGQLYIDKQGQIKGSTSTFCLGTKQSTKRYIDQFTEILTENGRKSVKITHQATGHPPQITFTRAAAAQGLSVSAPAVQPKEQIDNEANNLRSSPNKKCKIVTLEQSPPINTTTVMQNSIMTTTCVPPVAPKPIETVSIPAGIQPMDCTDTSTQSMATSAPLPTGVSLTSLSLAPVQQNLRLHNLVSLTPQGLAVPISLTMMSTPSGTQPSIMTTPGSMIVSLDQSQQKEDENVTVTYATTPATVLMSTGGTGSNVLSVPIGMAGSLGVHQLNAQFITSQLKQNSGQIRTTAPQVSLLQMSNSPILRPLAPHTYASSSSSNTFTQMINTPQTSSGLTPQQQLTNVLKKQVQVVTPTKPVRAQTKRPIKK